MLAQAFGLRSPLSKLRYHLFKNARAHDASVMLVIYGIYPIILLLLHNTCLFSFFRKHLKTLQLLYKVARNCQH